jgi:hypothetical protein
MLAHPPETPVAPFARTAAPGAPSSPLSARDVVHIATRFRYAGTMPCANGSCTAAIPGIHPGLLAQLHDYLPVDKGGVRQEIANAE